MGVDSRVDCIGLHTPNLIHELMVSVHRINEVLDTRVGIQNGVQEHAKDGQTGCVEFQHVSFRYPDAGEDVLHDISFTAKSGQTVAFIGATGSGKSSLVNLIPRFYDVTAGNILVDGINVRDYDMHSLRDKIGYVSQKACCFPEALPQM